MHTERDAAEVAACLAGDSLAGAPPPQSSTSQAVYPSTKDTADARHQQPEPLATGTSPLFGRCCPLCSQAKLRLAADLIDTIPEHDDAAAQRPHIEVTNNAETTAAILENNVLKPSSSGQKFPPRHSWRSLSFVRKVRQWLSEEQANTNTTADSSREETIREDFCRYVKIAYTAGDNDEPEEALATFDTQCPADWISVDFLKQTWHVDLSSLPKTPVAGSLNNTAVYSFGRVDLAWSSRDNRSGWLPGKPYFWPKTYRGSFEVIDSGDFDVIIGKETIAKTKLLVLPPFLGCFKAHRHASRKCKFEYTPSLTTAC